MPGVAGGPFDAAGMREEDLLFVDLRRRHKWLSEAQGLVLGGLLFKLFTSRLRFGLNRQLF